MRQRRPSGRRRPREPRARFLGRKQKTGLVAEELTCGVAAALCYTMIVPTDDYTDAVKEVMADFERRGYNMKPDNFMEDNQAYRGFHIDAEVETPEGEKVWMEFQVHTPESKFAKDRNHPLFEEWRQDNVLPERKLALEAMMVTVADRIPMPDGILEHGNIRTRTPEWLKGRKTGRRRA